MIDAAVYLRISSESQIDGFGLDAQERAVREYATAHGYRILDEAIFREEAVRGRTDYDRREAFMAMKAYLADAGVSVVVVPKLDRVARDLLVQETIIGDLRKIGVTLVSVAEPDLNSDDPTRVMLRQFMGAIAEWDAKMIARRMKSGRIERAHKGERAVGAVPYGYKSEVIDGRRVTVIDEETAEVVRTMFRLYDPQRKNYTAIATHLNEKGVKSPRGKAWGVSTVKAIIANPIYRGGVVYHVNGRGGDAITAMNDNLVLMR